MLVEPGELAIYCPTCPQPGINIPDNWKDDSNRFVFRRLFVADGNFKADHVRQPKSKGDHWLSEGGGMDPKHDHYMSFCRVHSINPPSVHISCSARWLTLLRRKPHVKTHSGRS